jgi:methionyl-tRNA synthetase
MEFVKADVIARYQRMDFQINNNQSINSEKSENVFFNTGTDEHGMKIHEKAKELGMDTQAFVDEQSKTFSSLKETLNISYDKFIRTTDTEHIKAAQEFWKKCDEAGYIYKKNYEGLYCVGCEAFVNEKDLIKGECQYHPGKKPQIISEENYFFKYSALAKDLLKLYKQKNYEGQKIVIPDSRLNEITKLTENGLEDFSISRLKEKMSWGIPVPGDTDQVMYVWFDALVNYISTLGWPDEEGNNKENNNFDKFWKNGTTVQICGKDNLQFQAARWQAMLLSVGLPTTDSIIINGFITSHGQKMSKSVGNVIDPMEYVEKYGSEAVRYFVVRELHPYEDSDFDEDKKRIQF